MPLVLPGGVTFRGRIHPISLPLLSCLAIRCRQRVLSVLEHLIIPITAQNTNQLDALPPGMIETYVRLLYMSTSQNRSKLEHGFKTSENSPRRLHTLVEAANFRLIRFFNYHRSTRFLFSAVLPKIGTVESLSFVIVRYPNSHSLTHSLTHSRTSG